MTEDILDSLFHWAALRAYLEIHASTRQFPPDSEATRLRAYQLYEEALAEKNRPPLREAGEDCAAPEGGGEADHCAGGKRGLRPETTARKLILDDPGESC